MPSDYNIKFYPYPVVSAKFFSLVYWELAVFEKTHHPPNFYNEENKSTPALKNWERGKATIFTENWTTQTYLFPLLSKTDMLVVIFWRGMPESGSITVDAALTFIVINIGP